METSQPTQHIAVPNSPVNQPKRLRASEGVNWFAESWRIFNKYKLKWIGAMVLFFLIPIALGLLSSYAAEGSQPMTFNQIVLRYSHTRSDHQSVCILGKLLFPRWYCAAGTSNRKRCEF